MRKGKLVHSSGGTCGLWVSETSREKEPMFGSGPLWRGCLDHGFGDRGSRGRGGAHRCRSRRPRSRRPRASEQARKTSEEDSRTRRTTGCRCRSRRGRSGRALVRLLNRRGTKRSSETVYREWPRKRKGTKRQQPTLPRTLQPARHRLRIVSSLFRHRAGKEVTT